MVSAAPILDTFLAMRRTAMQFEEKDVVLMIADISGYTEFMLANQMALLHSQIIINELIEVIIEQVQIPLKVAKLEGDAVFLYAFKETDDAAWQETRRQIGGKLVTFFNAFAEKLHQLKNATHCNCGACSNIEGLRLKIIAHSGRAAIYKIGEFMELSGVDVIIVHRLLKNSVGMNEYILLTDAAARDIPFTGAAKPRMMEEIYPAIGAVKTHVYVAPLFESGKTFRPTTS